MKYHLIAVGGSIMHNLAIDLQDLGHQVSGSDDEIYEPSRSRLAQQGLLPPAMGWYPSNITSDIDQIILGKHAKHDNPELAKAQQLGLSIVSFPEFVSRSTTATQRIAVTGSHGKTTTTAMIMYALKKANMDFDYLVGAQIKGYDKMVRLSGADILVVEGDEYPSSCLDNRAKMLHYDANVSILTGVDWDHVNIYKTYEDYLDIFRAYLQKSKKGDLLFFDQADPAVLDLVLQSAAACTRIGYEPLIVNKKSEVQLEDRSFPIAVFGQHNLKNLHAAMMACEQIGICKADFLGYMSDFTGAAKRLECIHNSDELVIYKDFAHAPSKAKATAAAIRSKFRIQKIFGVLELHTYSSLQMEFIEQYADTLSPLDEVVVYFDPAQLALKRMPALDVVAVAAAFRHSQLTVVNDTEHLQESLSRVLHGDYEVVLLMSSGNLGGIDPLSLLS